MKPFWIEEIPETGWAKRSPCQRSFFWAAIPAIISAIGAIGGASISSSGAGKASDTLATAATAAGKLGTDAAAKSNELLKAIYEGDLTKLQPYFDAGYEGLTQLTDGLKEGGYFQETYPYFNFDVSQVTKEPGYAFRQQQGEQSLNRTLAAKGGALGGAAVKEAVRYNQGFASNEVGASYNRQLGTYSTNLSKFQQDRSDRFNRLSALAGFGERATNTEISMGQTYGANTSNNLMNGAKLGSEALTGAANARASGYVSQGNIWGNTVNTLGGIASDYVSQIPKSAAPNTIGAGTVPTQTVEVNNKPISIGGKMYVWNGTTYVPVGG